MYESSMSRRQEHVPQPDPGSAYEMALALVSEGSVGESDAGGYVSATDVGVRLVSQAGVSQERVACV